jgi:hypothetical protein
VRVNLPQEIAIVGLARNCSRSLARDLTRVRQACASAAKVHLLVIESDSTDATPALLATLSEQMSGLRYLSLGSLRERHPLRTDRIAQCRNAYLDALAADPRYAAVSHVLVADLDRVCKDIDARAVESCWQLGVPWDMCSANQGDYYYDIWALRHAPWCPADAWAEFAQLKPLLGEREATKVSLFSRMVHIDRGAAPIEVESAFGGLAIYRREALLCGARYVGLDPLGREVCEHVEFHAQLRGKGFRLFINPALINAKSTRHGGRKKFWRSLRRRLWNALGRHD